ncbi:hypothetical protein HpBGD16_14080 [Helicobacter pylori]
MITVAVRNDLPFHFTFPKPTHLSDEINTKLDFKDLPTRFKKPFLIRDAFNLIDYSNSDDTDNLPMQHNPKTIERFQYIQEGKNIQECIESLPKHLQISKFYSRGNTMRLKMDALSPTFFLAHTPSVANKWVMLCLLLYLALLLRKLKGGIKNYLNAQKRFTKKSFFWGFMLWY